MKTLCFAFFLAACSGSTTGGNGGSGGAPPIDGLVYITVTPADQTLVIAGTTAATSGYHAEGIFKDGHHEDVTTRVSFRLADTGLGSFAGPAFTSQTDHGGFTSVIAEAGDVQGSTTLTLLFRQRGNDPASTNLPPDPGSKFGGTVDPGRAPDMVYPNDGVLVPPNLGKLEFHFHPGANNTLFELSFANNVTDVKIYLRCTMPLNAGCIYQPDPLAWHWIAETNRGGAPLMISIKGTDDNGSGVGASGAMTMQFSKDNINGGLYYWTTSNGTGIMRFDFASATQTAAVQYLGTQLTGGTCVGCHALSRDGHKIVAEAGGQNDGRILLLDVATTMPIVPFGQPPKSTFESWNPTGSQYAGVYGDSGATDFNVLLFDGTSGAQVMSIAGTGSAQNPADHPDWSPDGMRIVYVKVGIPNTLQKMHEGAIEMITDMGGVWSAPAELIPHVAGKNHYYPAFSPDGSFIVYDESTCSSGGTECNADTDASARLWAIKVAGGNPVEFARANAPGIADGANHDLTNSFPKWSPFVFQRTAENGSKLEWVTFSSARQYGLRNPPPSPNGGAESPTGTLIWMAGVDPDKVTTGQDASYPAFALPFQDISTSNHIAQWTTQVVPPPM